MHNQAGSSATNPFNIDWTQWIIVHTPGDIHLNLSPSLALEVRPFVAVPHPPAEEPPVEEPPVEEPPVEEPPVEEPPVEEPPAEEPPVEEPSVEEPPPPPAP